MTKEPTIKEPTMEEPTMEEIVDWESRGISEATDGCQVEPDGTCEHGHDSWFIYLGFI